MIYIKSACHSSKRVSQNMESIFSHIKNIVLLLVFFTLTLWGSVCSLRYWLLFVSGIFQRCLTAGGGAEAFDYCFRQVEYYRGQKFVNGDMLKITHWYWNRLFWIEKGRGDSEDTGYYGMYKQRP